MTKGSGPRHIIFDETTSRAFLVTELDSNLIVFKVDEASGQLTELETISLYPESFVEAIAKNGNETQYPAEIEMHPNRKWLYITNRGLGAIFQFDVSGDRVKHGTTVLTGGNWPRHFTIRDDGQFLVVAQQLTNSLEVYQVDQADGHLEEVDKIESPNAPAFVGFYSIM